ncbi:lipoyl protein ligase domain-containing protein [Dermatobacter hominis]|uniref:lipoyl protein ligase domain-containing protein n=1 Tax=Dermatobacter hominis TaxID=2884263 RepID=UPI001D0F86A8|nr:hypothetical protein [Dermatobacter hominis]UDY35968.1 hypothetical protein LH044_00155 [Dermatobacter hominis]
MAGAHQRTWRVEDRAGTAQELHDAAASETVDGRAVVVQHVAAPALVLGSTQDLADVDADRLAAAGVELARRRSGGGAVLLHPDDHVWVDLVVPAGDPLWDVDVERAAWWVGDAWVRALGLADDAAGRAVVHRTGVTDREAGRVACFAALGPGEVELDGRKVLGVSQRRTRSGARFQCVAYRRWDPELLLSLLGRSEVAAGPGRADAGRGVVDPHEVERRGPAGSDGVAGDGGDPVRRALVARAGAVVTPGWGVVEQLLPALP